MTSGSLSVRERKVAPKRMLFDQDEWVCLKDEDYSFLLERMRLQEMFIEFVRLKEPHLKKLFDSMSVRRMPHTIRVSESDNHGKEKPEMVIDEESVAEAERLLTDPSTEYVCLDEFVKVIAAGDLRRARKEKEITQRQLAQMAGVTQAQVSNLEKDPASVSVQTLRKVARALGVKIFV